jgi:hypothetical protein
MNCRREGVNDGVCEGVNGDGELPGDSFFGISISREKGVSSYTGEMHRQCSTDNRTASGFARAVV